MEKGKGCLQVPRILIRLREEEEKEGDKILKIKTGGIEVSRRKKLQ